MMACIQADGTVSPAARAILDALTEPLSAEEIAGRTGLPLFRVRSGLREMEDAGLVTRSSGTYALPKKTVPSPGNS
jgi:DNA-binding IclR family transcriptional regulator